MMFGLNFVDDMSYTFETLASERFPAAAEVTYFQRSLKVTGNDTASSVLFTLNRLVLISKYSEMLVENGYFNFFIRPMFDAPDFALILAALLHGTLVVDVSQTLRR